MTDIIEQLRAAARYKHHPPRDEVVVKELEWRAADEIERLRNELRHKTMLTDLRSVDD